MTGRQTDNGTGRTPPVAGFGWAPADASTHDTIRFYDYSYDPGHQGIATRRWEFGDGTFSDEAQPEHRYGADGEYDVTLTTWTVDARSCTYVQALRVRTRHDLHHLLHDTCIDARVGRRADVTIGITSAQLDEIVDVVLLKRQAERYPSAPSNSAVDRDRARRLPCAETLVTIPVTFSADDARQVRHARGKISILAARDPSPSGHSALALVQSSERPSPLCRLVVC